MILRIGFFSMLLVSVLVEPDRILSQGTSQATSYTFTGPVGGPLNTVSQTFTVTPKGSLTGSIYITPLGGKVSKDVVLTFRNSSAPQTFTITPTAIGPVQLKSINSGALTNPTVLTYATPPAGPMIGSAMPGNGSASVTFGPPTSTGGAPITGYKATCSPGLSTATGTVSPLVVNGLTNGTRYSCSVTATNAFGTSAASKVSNSVTPVATTITNVLFYPAQISPTVALVTKMSTVNLSSYADWRLFSGPGQGCFEGGTFDAKANGNAISPLYQTSPGNFCTSVGNYVGTLGPTRFTTSDGKKAPQTNLSSGIYGSSNDTKYMLVPANDTLQTFQLWITEIQARTNVVTFHLTDNSVPDKVLKTPITMGEDGQAHLFYTVDFSAASKGQFLVVSFANANSFDQFQAATLANAPLSPNTYNVVNGINPQYVVDFVHENDVIKLVDGYSWIGTLTMPVNKGVTLRSSVNLAKGYRVKRSEIHASFIAPNDRSGGGPIIIPGGARNIIIDGIEIANSISGVQNYGLVKIGPPRWRKWKLLAERRLIRPSSGHHY